MTLKSFFACLLMLLPGATAADNSALLRELDEAIDRKQELVVEKEKRIGWLKKKLAKATDSPSALATVSTLYDEYQVYKFDSAMVYADRGLAMAHAAGNAHYSLRFTLCRSEILAMGGLYNQAVDNLNSIAPSQLADSDLFDYYFVRFKVFSYWSDYCHDRTYAPQYRSEADSCLRQAMRHADRNNALYEYYQGEACVYVTPNQQQARIHYQRTLELADKDSRAYAMASYALAGNYRLAGDNQRYEEYLIRAALSDLKGCTMENVALQNLAVFLFEKGEDHIERAERYINISMEDAKFFNNRLRILEISQIMPQIMKSYQSTVKRQMNSLRRSVLFISLLLLALLVAAYWMVRQNRLLTARRRSLAEKNTQLTELNNQLAEGNVCQQALNTQLKQLNERLMETNRRREALASTFIDLCAKYIDKLGKYQTLVKRKIKANQVQELLTTMSSARISEEDAATFLNRFDSAFLELYPTFVDEFNALLLPTEQLRMKTPGTLPNELRLFALMRLGVKNTADIAGLLFLSPQTVYNARSAVRHKAINRDTFDDDVLRIVG